MSVPLLYPESAPPRRTRLRLRRCACWRKPGALPDDPVRSCASDFTFPGGSSSIVRKASEVDPSLLDDTETDRLFAGVARLLYRHIAEGQTAPVDPSFPSSTPLTSARGTGGSAPLVSADFDEELFVEKRKGACIGFSWRRCWLLRCFRKQHRGVRPDDIFALLRRISAISAFRKEVVVLSAIYLERLLERNAGLLITPSNWRPLLIAALHLASKTWEDVHAWTAELSVFLYSAAGVCYPPRGLNALEMRFLTGMQYRMEVSGELYAAYYFSLREADEPPSPPPEGGLQLRSHSCGSVCDNSRLSEDETACDDPEALSGNSSHRASMTQSWRPAGGSSFKDGSFRHFDSFHPSTHTSKDGSGSFRQQSDAARLGRFPKAATCLDIANMASVASSVAQDPRPSGDERRRRDPHKLDPANPYVGTFRHAPRAAPPSNHIDSKRQPNSARRARRGVDAALSRSLHSGADSVRGSLVIPI